MCVMINNITLGRGLSDNMLIKNLFIRYLLTFIVLLLGPAIMLPLAIALGILGFPVVVVY